MTKKQSLFSREVIDSKQTDVYHSFMLNDGGFLWWLSIELLDYLTCALSLSLYAWLYVSPHSSVLFIEGISPIVWLTNQAMQVLCEESTDRRNFLSIIWTHHQHAITLSFIVDSLSQWSSNTKKQKSLSVPYSSREVFEVELLLLSYKCSQLLGYPEPSVT